MKDWPAQLYEIYIGWLGGIQEVHIYFQKWLHQLRLILWASLHTFSTFLWHQVFNLQCLTLPNLPEREREREQIHSPFFKQKLLPNIQATLSCAIDAYFYVHICTGHMCLLGLSRASKKWSKSLILFKMNYLRSL